ncbi:Cd209 antigen [Plakobranchus ocellatus]|uniref:Cd209 antigen n=1 Tax=Plakobranchus ocellatus TaxID=259542 RepID=A0AAV3Z9F6_9GAST|nr:Cd209 antigen [Plakobranchus ocellatus]
MTSVDSHSRDLELLLWLLPPFEPAGFFPYLTLVLEKYLISSVALAISAISARVVGSSQKECLRVAKFGQVCVPRYWISKVFPKTNSVYFVSRRKAQIALSRRNELCKSIGGYLVELDSLEEQLFVTQILKDHDIHFAITGANDFKREGTFVYYNSKKPIPALKWWPGMPDNWKNAEDCVQIWWGGLNDINCEGRCPHICEIRLKV